MSFLPTCYCRSHRHPFPLQMYHRATIGGKYILACTQCRYIRVYRPSPWGDFRLIWHGDGARFVA